VLRRHTGTSELGTEVMLGKCARASSDITSQGFGVQFLDIQNPPRCGATSVEGCNFRASHAGRPGTTRREPGSGDV
jgi:hypothetical protein